MANESIHDSANVMQAALRTAILSAALALIIDVIVHHKRLVDKQQVAMTEPSSQRCFCQANKRPL
ncbi:MAG TPA: hypothetical protein VHD90_20875 [Phototrophicaceae bacterium]|nr:hypothetical protein [Phototrophicaceae bacterium]